MMILSQWFTNKSIHNKLVALCILSSALLASPTGLAVYQPGTQKPVPPDRILVGGTTRGCSGGDMPLTVLAPRNYMGRTISRHPTLAWFVPPDSVAKRIEVTIYEWVPGGNFKEVSKTPLQSTPGVMNLSPFSQNEPGLQLGKEYLWQVVLRCDPDNQSGDLLSRASFEVVKMPTTMLQTKLNKAINSVEKTEIYAEEGLWYDALGEALKLAKASKLGEVGSTLLNDLAKSEALKTISALPSKERIAAEKQVEDLRQIARNAR
jgi:Domain of Unknown Function (DUF928)